MNVGHQNFNSFLHQSRHFVGYFFSKINKRTPTFILDSRVGLLSRGYVNKLVNQIELCIATNVGQIFGFSLGFLVTLPKSAKRCPRPFSSGQ